MFDKDILCATDLSPTSDDAVRAADAIAIRLSKRTTLLHVLEKGERSDEGREQVLALMNAQSGKAGATERTTNKLRDGDPLKAIAEESKQGHSLLVLCTHGGKGLRQHLFGTDILKLVRHAATPSIVVQEGVRIEGLLKRIVMPVAAHADIDRLLDAVISLARSFDADVHVYQLVRPGEAPSPELLANKAKMLHRLSQEGIRHQDVIEPSTAFSIGFAQATIGYAEKTGAGALAIMAHASDEYRYIADAEKERILSNAPRIPVLCA
ncbi:MAG: universal stress protein [Flavobacteriales bacterium]|jgi:nucleotide-binding universal stress UspA family protein|nr:universal stress protein [Flavobacteriales bacterium]